MTALYLFNFLLNYLFLSKTNENTPYGCEIFYTVMAALSGALFYYFHFNK